MAVWIRAYDVFFAWFLLCRLVRRNDFVCRFAGIPFIHISQEDRWKEQRTYKSGYKMTFAIVVKPVVKGLFVVLWFIGYLSVKSISSPSPNNLYKRGIGVNPPGIGLASFDTVSPCTSMPSLVRCRWSPVVGWWNRAGIRILQTKPKSHFVSPLSVGVGTVGTDRTDCLIKTSPATEGRLSRGFVY